MKKRVMIVAGEASGDHHGAMVVAALRRVSPSVSVFGIGGDAMRREGVEIIVDANQLSVVGLTEVVAQLPRIIRGMTAAKECLKRRRPDLLILIDFPDFNLRLAEYARQTEIRILYYISPQIWAWRASRVKQIARLVDHIAVILPFEQNFYHKHGVPVTFVGHPLMDNPPPQCSPKHPGTSGDAPVIALLPGSRNGEVERLLPVMLRSAKRLLLQNPETRFIVSHAPSVLSDLMARIVAKHGHDLPLTVNTDGMEAVYRQSHFVIAASGTVTLETAIAGVPMVVIYKVSALSYLIGRLMIRVDHISLVNLISGRRVVPELIQADASPGIIAQTAQEILRTPETFDRMRRDLQTVHQRLGYPGAAERVANIAVRLMNQPGGTAAR